MNEFSLNIYSNKAEELRQETEATFEQLNLATDVLPATMQPDDGAIKLVFVGQYSAGKSSIIKMIQGLKRKLVPGLPLRNLMFTNGMIWRLLIPGYSDWAACRP